MISRFNKPGNIKLIKNLNTEYFECEQDSKDLPYVKNLYWWPIKEVSNIVEKFCIDNHFTNVLEIGPGSEPFLLAKTFIGYNEKVQHYLSLDIDKDKIPFEDKHFDFIYSRHTMEDIQNPDFALTEIIRTTNSGYIETPSPLLEITKGIDASSFAHKYGGYMHHRYIVWSSIEKCEIYLLPKYSCIIDGIIQNDEKVNTHLLNIINNYPVYWNNYFMWKDKTPNIIMYKNGVNMNMEDYMGLVNRAVNESLINTNYFITNFKE
jgi:SAM-dependent methyltransferase